MSEHESSAILTAVERINQMFEMLKLERSALQRERDVFHQTNKIHLEHLESLQEHFDMTERNLAASSRLEGELRQSIVEVNKALERLPGKRFR